MFFKSAPLLMLLVCTSVYSQSHTSSGGGLPGSKEELAELCKGFLRSAEAKELEFLVRHNKTYKSEKDFFDLLSTLTLKNDLGCDGNGIKLLKEIKSVYVSATASACPGFHQKEKKITLLEEVIKMYGDE
jgi:hypothetical protein